MDCWGFPDGSDAVIDSCVAHNFESSVLWGIFGGLWAIALVLAINALRLIKRNKPVQERIERRILLDHLISCISFTCLGFVKCTNPHDTAIGRHLASTLLFAFGNSAFFTFVLHNPMSPAGAGITLFALQRKKRLYIFYRTAFPFLVISTLIASFVPVGSVVGVIPVRISTTVTFSVFAIVVFVSVMVQLFSLHKMRSDFTKALRTKKDEVTESQKKGIEVIVESTGKIDLGISICASYVVIGCLLIASGAESVLNVCWALLPSLLFIAYIWVMRYIIVSRLSTLKVLHRRRSRGVSLTPQQGNSVTVTASSSQLVQSPNMRRRYNFLSSSTPSSMSSKAANGISSNKSQSSTGVLPKMKKLNLKRARKARGIFKDTSARFLTRVEEAENEGTIVSKYDYEWVANMPSVLSSGHQHNKPPSSTAS